MWSIDPRVRERAGRYRLLDRRLATRTRFFGAAAVISETLLFTATPVGRVLVSRRTHRFLSDLGAELEALNLRVARAIDEGALRGGSLDAQIVTIEQSWVQKRLTAWRSRSPSCHAHLVAELDRLLLLAEYSLSRDAANWRILRAVLRSCRAHLRRPLQFELQEDREAIGNSIIRTLYSEAS